MKIRRYIETKRAPKTPDTFGGSYTPAGIDVFTTDDPGLVKLNKHDSYSVRVEELLSVLDELDAYEGRRKFPGEEIELRLEMIKPEKEKGDVYSRPGFITATPHDNHKGLVRLEVHSRDLFGGYVLTAERDSLRLALKNRHAMMQMEKEDRARYGESS